MARMNVGSLMEIPRKKAATSLKNTLDELQRVGREMVYYSLLKPEEVKQFAEHGEKLQEFGEFVDGLLNPPVAEGAQAKLPGIEGTSDASQTAPKGADEGGKDASGENTEEGGKTPETSVEGESGEVEHKKR